MRSLRGGSGSGNGESAVSAWRHADIEARMVTAGYDLQLVTVHRRECVTMNRREWLRAIKSADFPRELRPIRATLLTLADVMTADGNLVTARAKLADRLGLPSRTVDRHLARAVASGYLAHESHGSRGRLPRYLASVPAAELRAMNGALTEAIASHGWRANSADSPPPSTRYPMPDSAPPGGVLKEESEQREGEAVDSNAQERLNSGSLPAAQEQLRSEEGCGLSTLEIARIFGCQECQRLAVFGQPPCPWHRSAKPPMRVLQPRAGARR